MRPQLLPLIVYNFFIKRFLSYILFKLFLTVLGKYCSYLCIVYSCSFVFGGVSSNHAVCSGFGQGVSLTGCSEVMFVSALTEVSALSIHCCPDHSFLDAGRNLRLLCK